MSFEFKDNSQEVLQALERAERRAAKAIGMTAEKYAKDDTPVDTGRLRNSITHTETDKAIYIGTNVEYAPYIEYGAQGRKAYHMLQKAATTHGKEYKQIMKQSMENA